MSAMPTLFEAASHTGPDVWQLELLNLNKDADRAGQVWEHELNDNDEMYNEPKGNERKT